MKKIVFLIIIAAMVFSLVGCDSELVVVRKSEESVSGSQSGSGTEYVDISGYTVSEKGTPEVYGTIQLRNFDDGEMPISGFLGPSQYYLGDGYLIDSTIRDDVYKKLADCGVNLINEQYNDYSFYPEVAESCLTLAEKYGISYFLKASDIMDFSSREYVPDAGTMQNVLSKLTKYKSLAGIYLRDEPNAKMFPAIKNAIDNFNTAKTALGEESLSVYYNLFPQVGGVMLSGEEGGSMSYGDYLQAFLDLNPDYLMFDCYPIVGLENKVYAGWLDLLGQINTAAKTNGVAWQGYAQAGGEYPAFASNARVVTEAELNWDVNTMLAFGAKGISYYPLVFPPEFATICSEEDMMKHSLITKYGNTTPFYYYAQKINKQIAAMDEILMKSAHMGVIVSGEGLCLYNGDDKLTSFRGLKSVEGDAALTGCFDYKGGMAFYVVNNSTQEHRAEVKLNFDKNYGYDVIQRGVTCSLVAKSFTLTLEAGEGAWVTVR